MKLFMTAGVILSLAASSGAQAVQLAGNAVAAAVTKHQIARGETLWGLSNKYYGDPFKWGRIYNANVDKISNPDRIYPNDEINIPEITEIVKPAPFFAPEETAELPAGEGDAAVAVTANEVSLPAAGNNINAPDLEVADLSMEMPTDQRAWSTGITTIVPENWKADGVIISKISTGTDDESGGLIAPGDLVSIKVRKPASFQPGGIISAYMKGIIAYDEKTHKKLGLELQKTGVLEVLSVKKNIVKARVLKSNTSVDSGQVIKR